MVRKRGVVLTEAFFALADQHLAGQKSAAACAAELREVSENKSFSTNTFLKWVTEAYIQGYLVLKTKSDDKTKNDLLTYINSHLQKVIIPYVCAGKPSHDMFALFAAECVINMLKALLHEGTEEISLGIVSGTSVCETIKQICESALWDEIIGPDQEMSNGPRRINVLTLSIPPAVGDDLYGNAIASVVAFARFLSQKLPKCKITPYGMMSPLIVNDIERAANDIINLEQLRIVDPDRLAKSKQLVNEQENSKKSVDPNADKKLEAQNEQSDIIKNKNHNSEFSKLDMVLLGAGPKKEQSIFSRALDTAKIVWPEETIGDVGFIPIKKDGRTDTLTRKGEPVFVYGLLSADLMRELVIAGKKVVLIARNSRLIKYAGDSNGLYLPEKTNKVQSIKAAIRGGFCNFLITDKSAADAIMSSSD